MSIYEEEITIISIYAPNNRTPKHMKKTDEIKGEKDNLTIAGDFNNIL